MNIRYLRTILLSAFGVATIGFVNFRFLLELDVTLPMLMLPFLVGGVFGGLIHHIAILGERSVRTQERLVAALDTSDRLLSAILPDTILARLKAGETPIIDRVRGVQILFIDLVGFTALADKTEVTVVAESLDHIFRTFEGICHRRGVRKLKTIGDAFVMVHGIDPATRGDAQRLALAALDVAKAARDLRLPDGTPARLRMGFHLGTVVMGVLGDDVPTFDIWGDAINTASRLESTGQPDCISCSRAVRELLASEFEFEAQGYCEMKGKGQVEVWRLLGPRTA